MLKDRPTFTTSKELQDYLDKTARERAREELLGNIVSTASDILSPILAIAVVVAITTGFVYGTGSGINYLLKISCTAQAEAIGVPYSYGFLQGCMITIDGKTIPVDSYHFTRITN